VVPVGDDGTFLDVESFRAQLDALLVALVPSGCRILVVPSVREWALAHTTLQPSSHQLAMAVTSPDGTPLIVLQRQMTRGGVASAFSLMGLRGFAGQLHRIVEPAAFLEHTVLHEFRHHLSNLPADNEAAEAECDRWAFEHLAARIR
jgi:hypothetical protein